MNLRLGSRRSALAQTQSQWVARQLEARTPGLTVEIVLIETSGDQGVVPPEGSNVKAMFTKEIEEALLRHDIDCAVHSLKDMSAQLPDGLTIGAIPEREDPREALISARGMLFSNLPSGARMGTSAIRRVTQLRLVRPDLVFLPLRGNVDTRLKRIAEGSLDAIVLAVAGLRRLGRAKEITETFSADFLLPAIGQGALAIEIRKGDANTAACVDVLNHRESELCVEAERTLLQALGGSCQTPIAAWARVENGKLSMSAAVFDPRSTRQIRRELQGDTWDSEAVGLQLAGKLLDAGAQEFLS